MGPSDTQLIAYSHGYASLATECNYITSAPEDFKKDLVVPVLAMKARAIRGWRDPCKPALPEVFYNGFAQGFGVVLLKT